MAVKEDAIWDDLKELAPLENSRKCATRAHDPLLHLLHGYTCYKPL